LKGKRKSDIAQPKPIKAPWLDSPTISEKIKSGNPKKIARRVKKQGDRQEDH